MPQTPGKIFGIGVPRTATTSLALATLKLGYRTGHCYFDATLLERGEAFFDTPVYIDYPQLDVRYPGSKFILTWRDPKSWLTSFSIGMRGYLNGIRNDPVGRMTDITPRTNWRCYSQLFGAPPSVYTDDMLLAGYRRHRDAAEAYFRQRPGDFLFLDVEKETDLWAPLCDFLGRSRPDVPFPHSNKAGFAQEWDRLTHPLKVPSWL